MAEQQQLPQPPLQPPQQAAQQLPQITPEVYAFMLNHMARYPKARTKFGDTMLTMLRIVDHDPEEIARIMRACLQKISRIGHLGRTRRLIFGGHL